MRKPTLYFLTSTLVVLGMSFSCGMSSKEGPLLELDGIPPLRVGEVTESGIKLGGVIRLNEGADPSSLDPVQTGESVAHNVTKQIYDGLMAFDNDLELHPSLATSYELSDDQTTYTFHLRKGVRFHDDPSFPDGKGREFTAQDVLYSFKRVISPDTMSRGPWIFTDVVEGAADFYAGDATNVVGFKVIDDYTFQIKLTRPFYPFIYRLAMTFAFIHPKEAVEHYGDNFFQNPVGTGPFKFVHWKPNQEILLKRNTNYWKQDDEGVQLPYLDGVRFTLLPDFKTEFFELETGRLDTITSIHEDLWSRIFTENNELKPEFEKKYRLQKQNLFATQYYGFNLNKEPYAGNPKLRQAMNYAVNREAFIKHVLNGRGTPARGIVPPNMPNYTSTAEGYSYNPEKARQLLAEAGYPKGEGLPELVLELNSGGTTNENLAEAIQSQLAEVGINVRLQIVEWAQHIQNLDNGTTPFFRLGWIADYPDPENFLQLMWSENLPPGGSNYSFFSNEEYDRVYEKAIRTIDDEERLRLYQQAEKIAVDEAPWLFLMYQTRYRLQQPYVMNHELNAQEFPLLDYTWLDYDLERVEGDEDEV